MEQKEYITLDALQMLTGIDSPDMFILRLQRILSIQKEISELERTAAIDAVNNINRIKFSETVSAIKNDYENRIAKILK